MSPAPHLIDALLTGSAPADSAVTSVFWELVGPVPLRTGRVVACDPLADPRDLPFTRVAPVGTFPVELLIARHGEDDGADQRVAAAVWRFGPEPLGGDPPTIWEPAVIAGQDVESLRPGEFYGYGVDAGVGGFMGDDAARALLARMDAEDDYYERVIEATDQNYRHTRSWAVVRPDEADPDAAVALFSSGYGDGAYGSWWGLAADGRVLCVVTDFGLLGSRANE